MRILRDELGWMTRKKPIVLDEGDGLLPIYDERVWTSRVMISTETPPPAGRRREDAAPTCRAEQVGPPVQACPLGCSRFGMLRLRDRHKRMRQPEAEQGEPDVLQALP
jgi:hypothetical protein